MQKLGKRVWIIPQYTTWYEYKHYPNESGLSENQSLEVMSEVYWVDDEGWCVDVKQESTFTNAVPLRFLKPKKG